MRKYLLSAIAILLLFSLTIVACRKSASKTEVTTFNPDAAKEWYYATFKKSSEYQSYNPALHGEKSPAWTDGTYRNAGTMEIVEYPLVKIKNSILIPRDNSLTAEESKRIAAASLARLSFIKTANGDIVVREVDFIPAWQYLQKNGIDINKNSTGNIEKDFSGELVIKKWSGEEISRKKVTNGRITASGHLRKVSTGSLSAERISVMQCQDYLITEWEQICTQLWFGNLMVVENCSNWQETGNSWIVSYCDGNGGCDAGMSSNQCQCQMLGICTGNGDGPEQDDHECDDNLNNLAAGGAVSENTGSSVVAANGLTRQVNYTWKIFKQDQGLWYFESNEVGVHVKQRNLWMFQSLTHGTITMTGGVAGGNLECQLVSALPTLGLYFASMELNCKLKASLACKGSPLSRTDPFTSVGYFSANP